MTIQRTTQRTTIPSPHNEKLSPPPSSRSLRSSVHALAPQDPLSKELLQSPLSPQTTQTSSTQPSQSLQTLTSPTNLQRPILSPPPKQTQATDPQEASSTSPSKPKRPDFSTMPSLQKAVTKALEQTAQQPVLSPPNKPTSLFQKAKQGLREVGQDLQQTARRIQRGADSLLDRLTSPSSHKSPTPPDFTGAPQASANTSGSLVDRLYGADAKRPVYQANWDSLGTPGADFKMERAHALAVAADYAYHPPQMIDERMKAQGYQVDHFDIHGTQAFLATKGDHAILSFRGTQTDEVKDMIADAQLFQRDEAGGKVHAGFQKALDQAWPQIQETLQKNGLEQTPLFVTGHSLGGALATLAANRLHEQGQTVQGLYTYGSPRVGNDAFAEHLQQNGLQDKTWRVQNHNDIVAKLPPPWLAGGYKHVGQHVYLDQQGAPHHNPSAEVIRDNQRSLLNFDTLRRDPFENNGALDPMIDHRRSEYIQHLADHPTFQI